MLRWIRAGAFCCMSLVGLAHAQYLVDTGTPTNDYPAWSFFDQQALGGTFSLLASSELTSAQIHLIVGNGLGFEPIDLTLALYSGDPGGTALFTKSYDLTAISGWNVLDGFSWLVDAGTYTVTFATSKHFATTAASYPVPSPLPWWYWDPTAPYGWLQSQDPGFGIRIGGTQVSAVPEPETYALMALGLIALGAAARRRRPRT